MFGPEITTLNRRQVWFSQVWWQIVRWNVSTEWTKSNIAQIIPERVTSNGRQWQRCAWIQNVIQAVPTWEATTVNWKPCNHTHKMERRHKQLNVSIQLIGGGGTRRTKKKWYGHKIYYFCTDNNKYYAPENGQEEHLNMKEKKLWALHVFDRNT